MYWCRQNQDLADAVLQPCGVYVEAFLIFIMSLVFAKAQTSVSHNLTPS